MALISTQVVGPANVSATEIIVANSKAGVALAAGNVFRITLDGTFGGPQYGFNLRAGLTGGLTDNVIYTSNNVVTNTALLNALNNTANASPGLSPAVLAQQAALAAGNGIFGTATPAKVAGELLLVITGNVTNNAQFSLINPAPADGGLLSAIGSGTIATGNIPSTAVVYITAGAKAANANLYAYVGSTINAAGNTVGLSANAIYGPTPPFPVGIFAAVPAGNTWNLVASTTPVTNGSFLLGTIEQLS